MTGMESERDCKPGPLEDVRVIECGVFHAGPGAGAILGDLGADVIKVETPAGDPMREWSTIGARRFALPRGGNLLFEISNRNKRAICLDIRTAPGRKILLDLVRGADVFLTNLRKSTKAGLGIDHAALSRVNPRLIHANVSGYGPEGPVSDLGAYDPMGQARSGMMFVTGNQEPVLIQIAVLDQATCIVASHAILTALYDRERRGIGQEVHVSLYSAALWLLHVNLVATSSGLLDPNIRWVRSENSPVRNNFRCKDDRWIVGVHHPEEKYWPPFCEATEQSGLIRDPRFADYESRIRNGEELIALFDAVFATRTAEEWIEALNGHGLMFSPVQRLEEVLSDSQALASAYVVDFDHPEYGTVKIPGYPAAFSECRAGARSVAPRQGEHTDPILEELGLGAEEIRELRAAGVIR